MELSVCIITRNEAKKLEKCLSSFRKYDVEIVVVDTGSTDETESIIKKYADVIGRYDWCDDFSKARNYSLGLATYDWVLVIDSDEWVEYLNEKDITKLITAGMNADKENICVGRVERVNDISDLKSTSKGYEHISRLFNRKQCRYRGRIHEQVISINDTLSVMYKNVDIVIGHSGYVGRDSYRVKKAERNIRLLNLDLEEYGPDPYVYYQLGKGYYMLKDYHNASVNFEKGLSFNLDPALEYVQDMVETYGYALLNEKRIPEMMFLKNIYDEFAVSADYVFLMGLAYMNNEMYDEAIEEFSKATTYKNSKIEGCNSYKANYNIGVIRECLGDKQTALKYYKLCGDYEPAVNGIHRIKD